MKRLLTILFASLLLTACGSKEVNTIIKEEYEQLEEGMTIDEIEKIVGGLPSNFEYDKDEEHQSMHYRGEDGIEDSSTAFIDLVDGKVESKSEIGLITKKEEEPEEQPEEEQPEEEPKEKAEEEPVEEEESWDDFKETDKIIGKSDKDFTEVTNAKPRDVRNDKTGKWKVTKIAENIQTEEYARSYADEYMKDDEVHFIVNFNYNTTTWLKEIGGLLHVEVREYEDKEEHDASKLGNGMVLKGYIIYPDGDIEETEVF